MTSDTPGPTTLEKLRVPLLGLLIAVLFLQLFVGLDDISITWDEHAFIPAGYSYVATGDFRLNREQPPGMKLLFGLPGLWLDPVVPTDHPTWIAAEEQPNAQWAYGRHFLTEANDDGPQLIHAARLPVLVLTCLLAALVYLWARALYGTLAGLLAAGLVATSPNLIAHGHLATTDMGLTVFVFLAAFAYWRYLDEPTPLRAALAAGALALGLVAKFSGVFLLPLIGLWTVASPWFERKDGEPIGDAYRRRLRAIGPGTLAILAGGVLLASFFYFAPGRIDLYFRDMAQVGFNVNPDAQSYLLGEFKEGRFWNYFLVAFLVKTPVATLALLALRLAFGPRHAGERRMDLLFLLAPIAVFFFVISWKAQNIGLRYILPIYPFLFVYASGIVRTPLFTRKVAARAAVSVLAAYSVVTAARAYPHHLSYFNDAVGGPSQGIRYLSNSNVDWGQDFIRLRQYIERRGLENVRFLYSTAFDPGLYDLDVQPIRNPEPIVRRVPGVYVVGIKEAHRARWKNPQGKI